MTQDTTKSTEKPRKERKANADKRRRQLLEATRRSIIEHGLAKTTLATVAAEAGLSQGVAVFYFKSKNGLLVETLRAHYEFYDDTWRAALEQAGPDPMDRLMALITADFSEDVCSAESLSLWFAFWGEQTFVPQYAEVCREFDRDRVAAIREACAALMTDAPEEEVHRVAQWIDTLTDGFWQNLHLQPTRMTPAECLASTRAMIDALI
ncbi:TetR family transcriptional regulator C-terminal domain-containing protein [Roseovarius sp.]|uniref:TetR family transcriptional regulator C-terminal domain-containing protein n=1 Tax=Roseovarius sp. TaxID=1486281 RepID=UPI003D13F508